MSFDPSLTKASSLSPRVSSFSAFSIKTVKLTTPRQFTTQSSDFTVNTARKNSSTDQEALQKSPISINNPSIHSKNIRSQQPEDLITGISDFFDTKQVAEALKAATSVKDKVHVIDLITLRREEVRKLEVNMQFQKYKPLFLRYRTDFKRRQRRKKRNFGELSTLSSEVSSPTGPTGSSPALLQLSQQNSSPTNKASSPTNKTSLFYLQSIAKEKSPETSNDEYELKNQVTSMIKSPSPNKIQKQRVSSFQSALKQGLEHPLQVQQMRKLQKYKPVMYEESPRSKLLQLLPKEIVLKKQRRNTEEVQLSALNFLKEREEKRKKALKSYAEAYSNSQINEQKIALVSGVMEASLYNFLLKNQDEEAAKELVLNPEVSVKGHIKAIEDKVGNKFLYHQKAMKKQSFTFTSDRDSTEKQETSNDYHNRAKVNVGNRNSYMIEKAGDSEKYVKTEKSLRTGTASNLSIQRSKVLISREGQSSSARNHLPKEEMYHKLLHLFNIVNEFFK